MFKVIFVLRSGTNSTPGEQGMLFKLTLSSSFASYWRSWAKSLGDEVGKMAKGEILLLTKWRHLDTLEKHGKDRWAK